MTFPKKLRFLAASFLFCALLTGCGGDSPAPAAESSPASAVEDIAPAPTLSPQGVYTDNEKSFQVTIPDDYQQDESLSKKGRIVFLSPDHTCSVELNKLEKDSNLLSYTKSEFTKTYSAAFDNFQLKQCAKIAVGDTKGVALRFTCQKRGKQYTVAQYVLAGNSDYSVTYATINGDAAFFRMAEDSIETFRELNPEQSTPLAGRLNGTGYTDEKNRFTVTLPAGWKVEQQTAQEVIFRSGDKKSNINIQWGKADKQLLRYEKSYFTQYFQNALDKSAKITVFQNDTVSGKNVRYLECTYTRSGKSLVSKQYLVNSGDLTYRITFTAAAGDAGKVKFAEVGKSFRIIEN